MNDPVLLTTEGHIATLTINRPDARNAMSIEILEAMHAAVDSMRNPLASISASEYACVLHV